MNKGKVYIPGGWPELEFSKCGDSLMTVQLWTQIVGKIRLVNSPWINHSWHVTLYVSSTGLSTGSVPFEQGIFQLDFNFIRHELLLTCSTGITEVIHLYPRTVASFYAELMEKLEAAGINTMIYASPNELEPAIPFAEDVLHQSYDTQEVYNFWQVLIKIHPVFVKFRARFRGKCSPVHLFWGAFDLAVTRFSGRTAPVHQGGVPNMSLKVMQEAYSHEVSSCGFWPGSPQFPQAVFYAYCYPVPENFSKQPVLPPQAFYSQEMGEFILPYAVVSSAEQPENVLMQFLESTYEAAANSAGWDREALDCDLRSLGPI